MVRRGWSTVEVPIRGPTMSGEECADAVLRQAQSQAMVPPLEEQIAHTTKFLERAKRQMQRSNRRSRRRLNAKRRWRRHRSQRRSESQSRAFEGQVGPVRSPPVSSGPGVSRSSRGHPVQGGKTWSGEQELCSWLDEKLELRDPVDMSQGVRQCNHRIDQWKTRQVHIHDMGCEAHESVQ